jgi:hypothetical protein
MAEAGPASSISRMDPRRLQAPRWGLHQDVRVAIRGICASLRESHRDLHPVKALDVRPAELHCPPVQGGWDDEVPTCRHGGLTIPVSLSKQCDRSRRCSALSAKWQIAQTASGYRTAPGLVEQRGRTHPNDRFVPRLCGNACLVSAVRVSSACGCRSWLRQVRCQARMACSKPATPRIEITRLKL